MSRKLVIVSGVIASALWGQAQAAEEVKKFGVWTTVCAAPRKDQYGDVKADARCYIALTGGKYERQTALDYTNSFIEVILVDLRQGARIARGTWRDTCQNGPRRMAVDGKRIDELPMEDAVKVLAAGKNLIKEQLAPWPDCAPQNEHGRLGPGADKAFKAMMDMWNTKYSKMGK